MLKKLFIFTSFIAVVGTVSAQTTKGTLYVGGGLGFDASSKKENLSGTGSSITIEGPKSTSFSIVPGVGYFIADKLAIGMDLGFYFHSQKTPDENNVNDYTKVTQNTFVLTPYARKFFMLSDSFGFTGTLELSIGIGSSTREERNRNVTIISKGPNTRTLGFGVRPGIVFFPTSQVGLEANFGFVGFSSVTAKKDLGNGATVKNVSTQFGFGANSIQPTFSLGFRYYLAK